MDTLRRGNDGDVETTDTTTTEGEDYCVVAASTRMSTGFSILTRNRSMVREMSPSCLIASAGFSGDADTLHKTLHARQVTYRHDHGKPMSCQAMSQLLSNTLYFRRFFPYYTFNLCAGLDNQGKGCVYTYDAVGSFERTPFSCQGSGKDLVQPVLDNQLRAVSPLLVPPRGAPVTPLSLTEAIDLVKDCFASAGERDIFTGDRVEICIVTAEGIRREFLNLKLD
eukprot:jgi/Pico_ML_1/52408/g3115.t2